KILAHTSHGDLQLLTTEKDLARMKNDPEVSELAGRSKTLPVALALDDEDGFKEWLFAVLPAARAGGPAAPAPTCRSGGATVVVEALQHGVRARIRLLQLDTPILQLFERNRHAGHRAPHIGTRPNDPEIAVEILDLRLPSHGRAMIEAIEHLILLGR